jgi:L-alanine-DL-glutamate epimerase-like enolase superfamily enzyme
MTRDHIVPDVNGEVHVPDAPGLGVEIDPDALNRYRQDVEIKVGGKALFSTVSAG